MKIAVLLFALFFLASALPAQQKGAAPLPAIAPASAAAPVTRAVVIGISDYQDPAIPDLRFADRDAEAFANFLRSPAGGGLDAGHLRVLTNEQATTGQIVAAFDWLLEQSEANDRVIIYFSGHGDVELKTRSQLGFLLTWDAPAQAYMAGAFPVFYLQTIVETLSLEKMARVAVITDACHAGKLAGQPVGGAALTNANLARQFASEVKILSCQPNEFSLEGTQWGGGRGVFSYHLLDGLYGLADKNGDRSVSLSELDRYLEGHVSEEVAPLLQTPMVVGNKTEPFARVIPEILDSLRKNKTIQLPLFTGVDNRGLEDDVLAGADSSVRALYRLYKTAIRNKQFFEPAGACADAYYEKTLAEPALARLHSAIRREYAAALQDDAQQALNIRMNINSEEVWLSAPERVQKYGRYPRMLERAASLLGEQHYMYNTLKARQYMFEGYLNKLTNDINPDTLAGRKALQAFFRSLAFQPENPHTLYFISLVYAENLELPDSAVYYADQALRSAPQWLMAATTLIWPLSKRGKMDLAQAQLQKAMAIDSLAAAVLYEKGRLLARQGRYAEAETMFQRCIGRDSSFAGAYNWLGNLRSDAGYDSEAIPYYEKAIAIKPSFYSPYINLASVYLDLKNYPEAWRYLETALRLDSTIADNYMTAGYYYMYTGNYAESLRMFRKVAALNPANVEIEYSIACLYTYQGDFPAALQYLEAAFKKGYSDYEWLESDPDLAPLHVLPAYNALLKKYFPEKARRE